VLQHSVNSPADGDSVFPGAWSTDVSRVNPEGDKISLFGENAFITQNLNIYRKQYELVLSFGSLTQLIRLTTLTTVIPFIRNTSKERLQNIQNLQLLLGRCMALIVKRFWLELANRETKQVFNPICNDA